MDSTTLQKRRGAALRLALGYTLAGGALAAAASAQQTTGAAQPAVPFPAGYGSDATPGAPGAAAAESPTVPAAPAQPTDAASSEQSPVQVATEQPAQVAAPGPVLAPAAADTGNSSGGGDVAAAGPVPEEKPSALEEQGTSDLLPVIAEAAGGLTAQGVAHLAVVHAPAARKAAIEAQRAQQQADDAYSLFVPRVNLKASYQRLSRVPEYDFEIPIPEELYPALGIDPPAADSGGEDVFGLNLNNRFSLVASVNIPLSDYFLTLMDRYDGAQKLATVRKLQRKAEVLTAAFQAKRGYFELARAMASRRLAELRVEQLKAFTSEVQILVEGGEMSSVELAQARSRLAGAEAALQQATAGQRIAAHNLRQQLGLRSDEPVGINEPLLTSWPEPPTELHRYLQQAHESRPEVAALSELVAYQQTNRDAIAGGRYPALSLFGSVNYDNPNQRLIPPEEKFYPTWAVGAEVTWSPTNYVVQNSEVSDAELAVKAAREDLRALQDRITIEVTTAFENARAASGSVSAAETTVLAAQETLDARMALFRAGESTSRQVLDAEIDLRVAQLDYINNILSTHLAAASLEHAVGSTGVEPR